MVRLPLPVRLAAALLAALLLAPLPVRAATAIAHKIHYGPDDQQIVDVYTPDECQGKDAACPVVLWVHGGGWQHGDTTRGAALPMLTLWSRQGFVMVGVNYRLAPRVHHPAQALDVAAAIAWVQGHIGGYGGDARNISLLGHSAGAHLVALVATNPRFLETYGLAPAEALVNVFPIDTASFDLSSAGPFVGQMIEQAFGHDPAVLDDASPLKQVQAGGRYPAFIIAASKARFDAVAESRRLAKALTAAGASASVMVRDFPGKNQLESHGAIAKELADPDSTLTQALWRRVKETH